MYSGQRLQSCDVFFSLDLEIIFRYYFCVIQQIFIQGQMKPADHFLTHFVILYYFELQSHALLQMYLALVPNEDIMLISTFGFYSP